MIVPSYTCSAVSDAAVLAEKQIIFADHGSPAFNQEPADLAGYLGPSRIYIATHQYGFGAPIEDLIAICASSNMTVYEDIAAALGANVNGRRAGTFGKACFGSFDTTKMVNAPLKGGFIATTDTSLFKKAEHIARRTLRTMSIGRKLFLLFAAMGLVCIRNEHLYSIFHKLNFAWRGRATAETVSIEAQLSQIYTNRFAEWQASVVLPQLINLDSTVRRRRENYRRLRDGLLHLQTASLPPEDKAQEWAPIRFPILCRDDKMSYYQRGNARGVDFGFSFTKLSAPATHAMAHAMASAVLNLPFDAFSSSEEIERIIAALTEIEATDNEPENKRSYSTSCPAC